MIRLNQYKTEAEKKAFMCGLAFYLGYSKVLKLTYDVFLHNPRFATAENGVRFAYDPETHQTSGLGSSIDQENEEKAKKIKIKNISKSLEH